jgi:hypothetical protein
MLVWIQRPRPRIFLPRKCCMAVRSPGAGAVDQRVQFPARHKVVDGRAEEHRRLLPGQKQLAVKFGVAPATKLISRPGLAIILSA